MDTAFISHSSLDKYFVDLLIQLLKYHHIRTWYDSHDVKPGTKYTEEIENGLKAADYFIVVISQNSINSKWITRETASFLASKPDAMILPLVIEKVSADEVFKGLEEYQSILFYNNLLNGFKILLNVFDKEFLPIQDRRAGEGRRTSERREYCDRRRSPIIQRLRKGLWNKYSSVTDIGPFDDFDLLPSSRIKTIEILESEISNYEYFDNDGNQLEFTQKQFDRITYEVWEDMSSSNYVTAINVIESIAERIYQSFVEIKSITRRDAERRDESIRRQED